MGDSSSQRVGEWGGVMSVGRDSVVDKSFNENVRFLQKWSCLEPCWTEVWTPLLMIAVTMQTCTVWNDGWLLKQWRFFYAWQLDLYLYSKCKYFVVFLKLGYIKHISMLRRCINNAIRTINFVKKQISLQICICMSKYLSFVYYQGHFMFEYKCMYFS